MKRIVLRYGFGSGLMISALMGCSMLLAHRIGPGYSMLIGYTIMVASFLLVYFGVRSYRDTVLGGGISFGRALGCGLLIMLITTICYVGSWEVMYFGFMPHFMDGYFAAQIRHLEASGLDAGTLARRVAATRRSQEMYQNPLVNMAYTVVEPLPVGLLFAVLSAAVLRRKPASA